MRCASATSASLFSARTISFFGTNLAPIAVAFAVLGLGGLRDRRRALVRRLDARADLDALVGGVVGDRLPRRS